MRDGSVDLETGVVEQSTAPELRTRTLFQDRFVGAVRAGHSLSKGNITQARYFAGHHISVARRGSERGMLDEALKQLALDRRVITIVDGFATALALAKDSDLIATVPERHTGKLRLAMHSFALPFVTPNFAVSMLWHPRLHADPAHRWLRGIVVDCCTTKR